jgi:hypothetical protein
MINTMHDQLFWVLIFSINNENEFLNSFEEKNFESNEKEKISQFIHKTKCTNLKGKIPKTEISKMAFQLISEKKIEWDHLFALSSYYNLNIFVCDLNTKTYTQYLCETSTNIVLLYKTEKNKKTYYQKGNINDLDTLISQNLKLEKFNKPLKGISYYKVKDLEDISIMLNINTENKISKPQLYEKISLHCVWKNLIKKN